MTLHLETSSENDATLPFDGTPSHAADTPRERTVPFRVALVDDHEIVARGFADLFDSLPEIDVVATVASVSELLQSPEAAAGVDLVILDLRLADGSSVKDNVDELRAAGAEVLAFTGGDDAALMRAAARSGVLGVVRKSEPTAVLLDVVTRAASGEVIASTEWAAALDGDPELQDAGLSRREREVLSLYAAGAKAPLVAERTGVSESTVIDYIRRVRMKYERVGRTASTKVDLYKRALEDGILPIPGQQ
jgi:DNA-binding NarL/FixJ family response regulator